jgi:acyl dehydratase
VSGASGAIPPSRLLGDVAVGTVLPELAKDVSTTTVIAGAAAARDWRPMHHDRDFAIERQGVRDVFLDSPTQGSWFERYVTDWTGPKGRVGRLGFRMRTPVFPGDTMVLRGTVRDVETDDTGCGWVVLDLTIRVGDVVCTEAHAKVALPTGPDDNPWDRHADHWQP